MKSPNNPVQQQSASILAFVPYDGEQQYIISVAAVRSALELKGQVSSRREIVFKPSLQTAISAFSSPDISVSDATAYPQSEITASYSFNTFSDFLAPD